MPCYVQKGKASPAVSCCKNPGAILAFPLFRIVKFKQRSAKYY